MKKTAALIINPASGSARRANMAAFARIATELGWGLSVLRTERPAHATELARQAAAEGTGLVIACGGDGTVNEVLNGLMGTDAALGIVPLGTANVLAREVGLPMNPTEALRATLMGTPHEVALGQIESSAGRRYFGVMASAGLDATVVHTVSLPLKRLIGKAAYVIRAIAAMMSWPSEMLKVTVDGTEYEAQFVALCSGRKYAGEFVMAPSADITRAGLEVVMLRQAGRWAMLRFALAFARGRHLEMKGVEVISGSAVSVTGEAHAQIDGDAWGRAPLRVEAVPGALRMLW